MKKQKHKQKRKFRNKLRNAAPVALPARPRPVRAPRMPRASGDGEETPLRRLGYTAAGAAGTALVGSFLAREGWAPKTIAGLLTTGGAIASWTSADPTIRNIGSGAMSAAGGQLALMLVDDHGDAKATAGVPGKRANAGELPPGALENAFERARARMAVMTDDARRYSDGESA